MNTPITIQIAGLVWLILLSSVTTGKDGPAVLLRNGQVIYGSAHEEADRVVIEDETATFRLHRNEVLCWAESVVSLYDYRVDHRPQGSVKQHLIDAEWCLSNGLFAQAAREIIDARGLTGNSTTGLEIEKRLRLLSEQTSSSSTATVQTVSHKTSTDESVPVIDNPIGASKAERGHAVLMTTRGQPLSSLPSQLMSVESTTRFTEAIQPMLLNRCATAGCHGLRAAAAPRLEGWRFGVNAKITTQNLQEIGLLIDVNEPANSRIIAMSRTAHAGSESLSGKLDQELLERLIEWVYRANGVARPTTLQQPLSSQMVILPSATPRVNIDVLEESLPGLPKSAESPNPVFSPQPTRGEIDPPKRLPSVFDPFDPEVFNRSYR